MMGLSDAAMWVALMSKAGEMQMAVTTSFNINFLRKPPLADVIAESRAIKIGKRLAVLEVTLFPAARPHEPIAHATGTYSLPPDGSAAG
jgi:acyl-coenzyme A thioesterase PaaI-like protein